MRYFKEVENDKLISIGTGYGGVEISQSEYESLLAEIRTKATLVGQLYTGAITEDDIPDQYREEVISRVEERRAEELSGPFDDIDELIEALESEGLEDGD